MKNLIIFNGMAGEGSAKEKFALVEKAFEGLEYEIHLTTAPKEAISFIRNYLEANKNEKVRVYACGGDGTLHECANGVVGYDNVELAAYAIGTGNDFVKYYGGAEKFQDLKKLIEGKAQPIDLSKIEGPTLEEPLYSINVINFGFDAVVGAVGNKNKEKGKKNPYDKAIPVAIMKARFNKIIVKADGEQLNKKKMLLCTLAHGSYVGGKFKCAPESVNDDGLIDVCLLRCRSLFGFLGILGPYTDGKHLSTPKIRKTLVYKRSKEIEIEAPKAVDICVDGEMIKGSNFKVKVVPGAVKFVIPAE